MLLILFMELYCYDSSCKCQFELNQIKSRIDQVNNNINKILSVLTGQFNTTRYDELKKRKEWYNNLWKKNNDEYNQLLKEKITPEKEGKIEELKEKNHIYRTQIDALNHQIEHFE